MLPAPFLLNLADGHYAKLTVALELAPGQSDGASAAAASSSGESAAGTLPEEPLVREIVTDTITNQNGETLVSATGPQRDQAPDPRRRSRSRPTSRSKPSCSQTSPSNRRRSVTETIEYEQFEQGAPAAGPAPAARSTSAASATSRWSSASRSGART